MNEPTVPVPDDKDWTWVLDEPCPECGFDPKAISGRDVAGLIPAVTAAFVRALDGPQATVRPSPAVWSVSEYAAHVRDVHRIFARRVTRMLTEDDPLFENWDQDRTALEDRYWEQSPAVVSAELSAAAADTAALFAGVSGPQWDRRGRRSNGSQFTVDSIGRYLAHDLVHHVHDIEA